MKNKKLQEWRRANHGELTKCRNNSLDDADLKLHFELPDHILREAYYQVTARQRGIINTLIGKTQQESA